MHTCDERFTMSDLISPREYIASEALSDQVIFFFAPGDWQSAHEEFEI